MTAKDRRLACTSICWITLAATASTVCAQPANDDFEDATVIPALPFAESTNMAGATLEPSETQPSCVFDGGTKNFLSGTIWYRFTPATTGTFSANTEGAYNIVAAYRAGSSDEVQETACDDEDVNGRQRLTFYAAVGNTYYFQIGGIYAPLTASEVRFTLDETEEIAVREIVPFETEVDGAVLRGHVYLPTSDGPYATVLEYGPYWGNGAWHSDRQAVSGQMREFLLHDRFIKAGFAVAAVSVRGTGASDGCMEWGGPQDWADAAAVVESLAHEPWSNGNVGMFGASYPATTQYWAMAGAPPSLKAVIPQSSVLDWWTYFTLNGAPISYAPTFATEFTTETSLGIGAPLIVAPLAPNVPADHARCPRYADDAAASAALSLNGDRTPYYEARDLRKQIGTSTVPALVTNGLSSGMGVIEGQYIGAHAGEGPHLTQFEGLWDLLTGEHRFLLGQWGHSAMGAYPHRPDFPALAVAWFDHYLRGGPTVPSGIVEYQDDNGAWHTADRWPPPSTATVLRLSNEALTSGETAETSARSFQGLGTPCVGFCPVSDVSSGVPRTLTTGAPGPKFPQCVGDQLLYTSPPIASDVLLAGNFVVDLTVTSTLPEGNLAVYLWHTPGQGCPDAEVKEVRRAVASLRHWEDEHGRDFPVAVPTAVTVRSLPFASVVPAGHRLVLAVGGESWGLLPKPKPHLTVSTGPGIAGSLTLPVVDGTLAFSP